MEVASVYLELRDAITRVSPVEHGLAPTADLPRVWGVLVDVGLPPGLVTVVAIADGTTSLYLGNGGATVGVGVLPQVADPARALMAAVESVADQLPDGWDITPPPAGWVQVIALTFSGMGIGRATMDDVATGRHPLSEAWARAGEVAAAIFALEVPATAGGTEQA